MADGEESALTLEGMDEVELRSATVTELQQFQHHLSTTRHAVLSNRSTDWWKTLWVWGDLLQKQQWDPLRTRLARLTMATAAPGSIPSLLRDDATLGPRLIPEAADCVGGHAPQLGPGSPGAGVQRPDGPSAKATCAGHSCVRPVAPDARPRRASKKALGYLASADKKQ